MAENKYEMISFYVSKNLLLHLHKSLMPLFNTNAFI